MFFGHVAVGLAAKPVAPKAPLGALLVSATAIDTLWGVFAIAGLETMGDIEPSTLHWSHGLFMAVVWAIVGFAVAFLFSRDRKTGIVIGLLVFSHWVLDFVSWSATLPLLFEGSPRVGLGLYDSMAVALIIEFGLLAAGIAIYLVSTKAQDRIGKWGLWLIMLFLFSLATLAANPALSIIPVFATVLLLPLGNWVDRHRSLAAA